MYSSLATMRVPAYSGNYTKGRNAKISEITIHHMSGKLTAKRCGELFQAVGRGGSSHYGIGYDGEIASYVDESDTAWTNSNWESNCRAVTIETSNDTNAYPWSVSDKSLQSLIRLVADIAKRNNLGKLVKGKNLTWHQMYANTDCPGPYLLSKMDYIVSEANKIIAPPAPIKPTDKTIRVVGKNRNRGTNELILYSTGNKAGTNQWGYEVAIDKNGIALTDPLYKGKTEIPSGGYVLAGHGTAGKWLYANIKQGYKVTVASDSTVWVDKFQHRTVDNVNGTRGTGYLCVYNKGSAASTNPYGFEVAISKSGYAIDEPVYGKGHMEIPEGGFVVSGHQTNTIENSGGSWIYKNIHKGTKVSFDGKVVRVK